MQIRFVCMPVCLSKRNKCKKSRKKSFTWHRISKSIRRMRNRQRRVSSLVKFQGDYKLPKWSSSETRSGKFIITGSHFSRLTKLLSNKLTKVTLKYCISTRLTNYVLYSMYLIIMQDVIHVQVGKIFKIWVNFKVN